MNKSDKPVNKDALIWTFLNRCWHQYHDTGMCACVKCGYYGSDVNPDLSSPTGTVLLLQELRKRSDYHKFLNHEIGIWESSNRSAGILNETEMIDVYYIVTPGALRDAVWNWPVFQEWLQQANPTNPES